jgi:hypothetical protein
MPTATQPTGKRSKRGRLNEGRPLKRTPQLTACIAESISLGLTDEEAAAIADIQPETLYRWRHIPEFNQALKRATALRLRDRLKMISARVENWQALGWLCERQYYSRWSKPEVQISLSNSFNQTVNTLSISISADEAKQIEAQAAPIREKVREMFVAYRPSLGNGDDAQKARLPGEAIRETVARKFEQYRSVNGDGAGAERPLIVFRENDDPAAFWGLVANASGERVLERVAAVHVVQTLLRETVGQESARQAAETIRGEVAVADIWAILDRYSGAAGQQLLRRKAGYK